jgi:hypothetical protein
VNVNPQRILIDVDAAPDVRHELIFADKLSGGPCKFFDDFKGARPNRDEPALSPQFTPIPVHLPCRICVNEPG